MYVSTREGVVVIENDRGSFLSSYKLSSSRWCNVGSVKSLYKPFLNFVFPLKLVQM